MAMRLQTIPQPLPALPEIWGKPILHGPSVTYRINYDDLVNIEELNRWIELHQVACWVERITDDDGETVFWDYRIELDYMILLARQGVPRFRLYRSKRAR
jgi:hypothetical protein